MQLYVDFALENSLDFYKADPVRSRLKVCSFLIEKCYSNIASYTSVISYILVLVLLYESFTLGLNLSERSISIKSITSVCNVIHYGRPEGPIHVADPKYSVQVPEPLKDRVSLNELVADFIFGFNRMLHSTSTIKKTKIDEKLVMHRIISKQVCKRTLKRSFEDHWYIQRGSTNES